ncbi:brain protein I3 isoform X1 [Phyllostomus discolor]|uniref:Brain protein I3 isoform X1 n=1 Tax=Phyllostomus discolor TaxID=89673 RepID=A0A7E6CSS5_9CHIR|nr:brain protein I3 isoform X1 [Phyllostomus discolor]
MSPVLLHRGQRAGSQTCVEWGDRCQPLRLSQTSYRRVTLPRPPLARVLLQSGVTLGHAHTRDTHPPPQGLQHPQSECYPVPRQFHRCRRRLPSLQSWGSGGLLHLPGHLPGHRPVPLRVHLLLRLEEAKVSQLRSKLHLEGTAGAAALPPAVFS